MVSALTMENYRLFSRGSSQLPAGRQELSVKTRQFHLHCTGYEEQKLCLFQVTLPWETMKVLTKGNRSTVTSAGLHQAGFLLDPDHRSLVQIQSAVEWFIILWPRQAERRCQLSCTNMFHSLLPATFKDLVGADH